ncbi:hypothetical protein Tco_1296795, partial [Tanacetum coccineum]
VRIDEVVDSSVEEDVVHGSGKEDAEQGNSQEAVEETSGEQADYDVDRIDREDLDVMNLDGFDNDTRNDNEASTYRRTISKEANDIACLNSIESRRMLKLYKNDKIRFFDQVRVNPKIPIKAVQDQLQRDLELQDSMSKAFRAKVKVEREVK